MSKRNSLVLKVTAPIAVLGAMAMAPACVSSGSGDGGTGGTPSATGGTTSAGTSTSPTGGGATNSSATSATGGGGGTTAAATGAVGAVACLPVTLALITDFTYTATAADGTASPTDQVTFGDFTTSFSGGTTFYPNGPIKSDVTGNNWHITGQVADYSGLGMYWSEPTTSSGCTKIDASAYKGIQFSIKGTLPATRTFNIEILTAANQISSDWMNANVTKDPLAPTAPNFGRCKPAASQYDGSCSGFKKAFAVTADATTVKFLWADMTGGKPATTINPAEIVGLYWYFSWGGATDTAYDVDLTMDDLTFVTQ